MLPITYFSGAMKLFWSNIFPDTAIAHKGSSAGIESAVPGALKWCKLNSIGHGAWIQRIKYCVQITTKILQIKFDEMPALCIFDMLV